MPRISHDQLRAIGDLATTFRWNLSVPKDPTGLAGELNVRCESTELPKITMTPIENNVRGHKTKYPGIAEYSGSVTMTFTETDNNAIVNFIRAWRELHWETQSGVTQNKADLEATFIVTRLNSQDEEIYQYTLRGCLYEDSDFGSLDGENAAMKPTLTIGFDFFTEKEV